MALLAAAEPGFHLGDVYVLGLVFLGLAVFAAVNVALVVLKTRDRRAGAPRAPIHLPLAVPVLGALASAALLIAGVWL